MEPVAVAAGLLAVGALTPGPNNLLILRAAAEGGWRGALPAAAGVVLGGLLLLTAVIAGAGTALERAPGLATVLSLGTGLVLSGLGLAALRRGFSARPANRRAGGRRPSAAPSFGGLFLFQLLNPKAWVLVAAVASAAGTGVAAWKAPGAAPGSASSAAQLAALFVLIPAGSLALWSWAGVGLDRWLGRPSIRAWFDRLEGVLMLAFAALFFHNLSEVLR